MKNNVFFFPVWGKKYIENFSRYSLECLLRNLKFFEKKKLNGSKLEIWTLKKDVKKINKLQKIKNLRKIIDINFESIDPLLDFAKKEGIDKYLTLSILQKIMINSHSSKYEFFWFIYPDFIFSDNLIKNFFSLKKNYDAYFLPVPQLVEEFVQSDYNKNGKILTSTSEMQKQILHYLHPIVKICDIEKTKTNTPSMFMFRRNNTIAFRYYHMHPIIIRNNRQNVNLNNQIFKSLDEEMVEHLNYKNLFITKNSKFASCVSLLGQNEIVLLPNQKFSLGETNDWVSLHVNKVHQHISKFTYILNYKNEKYNKKFFEKKLNSRISKINNSSKLDSDIRHFQNHSISNIEILLQNKSYYDLIHKNYYRKYFSLNKIQIKREIIKNFISGKKSQLSKKIFEIYKKNI